MLLLLLLLLLFADVQSKEGFAVDEYFQLVLDIRGSGLIGDHRYHLRNYKNSFVGKELVDWLVANKNLSKLCGMVFVLLYLLQLKCVCVCVCVCVSQCVSQCVFVMYNDLALSLPCLTHF